MEAEGTSGYRYKKGDHVMYRNNGICRIDDIRRAKFGKCEENLFYVLKSVSDESSVTYVPVDSSLTSYMRDILTPETIDKVILQSENSESSWISDPKERAQVFARMLLEGCASDILWLYKALSVYKSEASKKGRKLYAADAHTLDAAREMVESEFSFVLGIEQSEVTSYILSRINEPTAISNLPI